MALHSERAPLRSPFAFAWGEELAAGAPAAFLGAAVVAGARRLGGDDPAAAFLGAAVVAGARRLGRDDAAAAFLGATVVAGSTRRGRSDHLRCGAGAGVTVVVGGEDHDRGREADDGDHRDGEQRAQLPVVGAENDCGVPCGIVLAMAASLSGGCLGGLPGGVVEIDIGGDHAGERLHFGHDAVTGRPRPFGEGRALLYVGFRPARVPTGMDFRILGPLEALDEGRAIALGGSKQRALLALLLAARQRDAQRGPSDRRTLGRASTCTRRQDGAGAVSRLRKALAGGAGNGSDSVVVTRERGYELTLDPERLDSHRFERLVAEGRSELAGGYPERAVSMLDEALSLWRGAPLAELAFQPFAQREIGRLDDLRVAALEQLIEAKLALGRHAEVVGQLEALIGEHPYREGLRGAADARPLPLRNAKRTRCRPTRTRAGLWSRSWGSSRGSGCESSSGPYWRRTRRSRRRRWTRSSCGRRATRTLSPCGRGRPGLRAGCRSRRRARLAATVTATPSRGCSAAPTSVLSTLTGPGGVGKTRLALEVARELEPELPDGAWLVSLAATAQAEHVPTAIAHAVGVTALQGETPRAALERSLAPKRGLLVLDNFEHLLAAASLVSDLLAACPALKVLATSREGLRLRAEHRYAVAPLPVPANGEPAAVEEAAAGALFLERARSHDRLFELSIENAGAIAEVCRRLDGLPLAIELAAARTTVLDAEELNTRLAETLDVLSGGPRDAPDRQRTLRATIDWSHRLLSAPEADAFARFAVFAGGATIEAAQAVTGGELDALQGLVDKQLLSRRHGPARTLAC